MAFEELLSWADGRPDWQQDALRRLAQFRDLTDADLSELRHQIESDVGLISENEFLADPLTADHLSESASNEPRTVLASVGPTSNVDRLESGQPPIRFAIDGLTIVYGPNASGKSGYCRILKQLCRSLNPGQLRGNAFESTPSEAPEVGVAFRVGSDDVPKTEMTWCGDDSPPQELARISVFDTACAQVFVDSERRIEFLPYELDLLNKLSTVCGLLLTDFQEREGSLGTAVTVPLPAGYSEGTEVWSILNKLVPDTPLDQLPTEKELRNLAQWVADDKKNLGNVILKLRDDPNTQIRLRQEARASLLSLKEDIANVTSMTGEGAIHAFEEKQKNAVLKSETAELSAKDLFREEPISAVGSESWRQMLSYARDFSVEVFPDGAIPQIATSGLCVLCQQDLAADAASRMVAFDLYLSDRAAEEAAAAAAELEAEIAKIQTCAVKGRGDVEAALAGFAALNEARNLHKETVAVFFDGAAGRLSSLKQCVAEKDYTILQNLNPLPPSPLQLIEDEINAIDGECSDFQALIGDGRARQNLSSQHAALTGKKKLCDEIELIVERRNKLEQRLRLADCVSQCRLTAITRQITRRRRDILTPSLVAALDDELKALQLTHLPLDLSDRGSYGESIVTVSLSAQQPIHKNSELLSEGEQRGLALACFLAELAEVGTDHGIVVDDPVSSLDHTRMEAVAKRLAKESSDGRQVIVFTHNILFHHMLKTEARLREVACHLEWITSKGNDKFGIVNDPNIPWLMKGVSERLLDMRNALDSLESDGYDNTEASWQGRVENIFTSMRTTWERVVEEILFNKAVQRFRPEVMTQRLHAAHFDPVNDYPIIFEGMKQCSHYSGHDLAEDLPPQLPTIDVIGGNLDKLSEFVAMAKKRKRLQEKTLGHYEDGPEPTLI